MSDPFEQMYELFGVADRVQRRMYAAARVGSSVNRSGMRIVATLLRNPNRTDREIRHLLGMEKSQFSREMNALIAVKLVVAKGSPDHGSQRLLALTKEGRNAAEEIDADLKKAFATAYAEEALHHQANLFELGVSRRFVKPVRVEQIGPRPASAADLALIFSLLEQSIGRQSKAAALRSLQHISDTIRYLIDGPWGRNDLAWVVEQGEFAVGTAVITPGTTPEAIDLESEFCWLRLLSVSPPAQFEHLGRQLVMKCVEVATDLTMVSLNARVSSGNGPLAALLEACGFRPVAAHGKRTEAGQPTDLTLRL